MAECLWVFGYVGSFFGNNKMRRIATKFTKLAFLFVPFALMMTAGCVVGHRDNGPDPGYHDDHGQWDNDHNGGMNPGGNGPDQDHH
ncbi:MAG: hypothetical protein ABSF29_10290 [Tepidisphaeraceae bacterium]